MTASGPAMDHRPAATVCGGISTPTAPRSVLVRACLALLVLGPSTLLPAAVAAHPARRPGFAIRASQSSPVTGAVTLSAVIQAKPGLVGVQFKLDGYPLEALDTTFPYQIVWSAASAVNGEHTISAEARYAPGDVIESAPLHLTVANPLAFNRTLYVDAASGDDANDGLSPSTAWRTLDRANQSLAAGDTVLLQGTFVGQAIRPLTPGTAAWPVTFRSAPGTTAVLDGGLFGSFAVLLDRAHNHIIVDGIAILNVSLSAVLLVDGAHHNTVRNCDLAGVEIRIYDGSSDNVIEANVIRDVGDEVANAGDSIWIANGASRNRILNNTLTNAGHGLIAIGGDQPGDADVLDNIVANNVLSNRWATPLLLGWRARRTLIEGNQISDGARNGVTPPRPGIQIAASENIIRYNRVFDNAGPGILIGGYVFGSIAQDAGGNQIYHNVFYGNGTPGGTPADAFQGGLGIFIFEKDDRRTHDNLIANNIFFRNSGFVFNGAIYSVAIDHFGTPLAWPEGSLNGNLLRNNIVLREPGSAGEPVVLRIRRPDQGGDVDYTVAEFEAIYPEAANNLEVDPLFTDEAKRLFTLQAGSPAINQGLIIAGVDFHGAAPDIGVFEVEVGQADLVLKSWHSHRMAVGRPAIYAFVVTNRGPDDATGVVVTDPLPASVTLKSAIASRGTCAGTATVTCDLGTLAPGARAVVAIVVTPAQPGTLLNTAAVTANETDPQPHTNQKSVRTYVWPRRADLIH